MFRSRLLIYVPQDFFWAAVFATADATVTLKLGGSQQTFNVGPGVSKLKIPTAPGQITVSMVRNGQTIINKSPTDFTFTDNPTLCMRHLTVARPNHSHIKPYFPR